MGEKLSASIVVSITFNNEQKHTNDSARIEQIVNFRKKQGKKE